MPFDGFSEDTAFESHRGDAPGPKRRRSRKPAPGPAPGPGFVKIDKSAGDAAADAVAGRLADADAPEVVVAARAEDRNPNYPLTPRDPFAERAVSWRKGRKLSDTGEWKPLFLRAYAEWGNVGRAAEMAGVCRQTIANHQKSDPDFKAACDEVVQGFREGLEEMFVDAVTRGDPIVSWDRARGCHVEVGRRTNIIGWIFLMKAFWPEKYNDKFQGNDATAERAGLVVIRQYMDRTRSVGGEDATSIPFDEFARQTLALESLPPTAAPTREGRIRDLEAQLGFLKAEMSAESAGDATS